MSKGLNQYRGVERVEVIARRVRQDQGGIGTWAAKDAWARIEAGIKKQKEEEAQRENSN